MLKPPFFTRSAAGEKFNHPPRINPHSSLAQVCNMVVPVSGRICATSLDFGPFCLGQRKMLSPKFSALACWWLSIAQPSAHWNTFNCLYCLNRELAILGCWTAIARDPESILLCSYEHLLVITGYFNGIIHFINGILLVLITGISGHNSGSSWISDFQAIASHGESGRSPRPGSGSPISHARNTASFQQGLAIRWDPS